MDTIKAAVGDYITWGGRGDTYEITAVGGEGKPYVLTDPLSLHDGREWGQRTPYTLKPEDQNDIEVFPVASYEYPEAGKVLSETAFPSGTVVECVDTRSGTSFTVGRMYTVNAGGYVRNDVGLSTNSTLVSVFKVVNTPSTPAPIEPPRVLALAGRAGSGKSTVAEHLISEHGYVRVKFAGPLKNMLRAVYKYNGVTGDEVARRLEGDLKEVPDAVLGGRSPRHAMQALGGEWGREMMHSDLWVSMWEAQVQQVLVAGFNVVVDDLRYANEAAAVHKFGGTVLGLTGREPVTSLLGHSSEVMDIPMDVEVTNTCAVDKLKKNVERAIGVGA